MGALLTWLTLIAFMTKTLDLTQSSSLAAISNPLSHQALNSSAAKLDRIKFACVVDRSVSIKVRHAPIPGHFSFWNIRDLLSNRSINFTSANETDSSYTVSLANELRNYDYNLTNRYDWMIHRIDIEVLEPENGAKELIFSRYSNRVSQSVNRFVIETITLDKNSECSMNHPLNDSSFDPNDFELTRIARVQKNQTIRFYCSIFVRSTDLDTNESNRPIVKWMIEKPSRLNQESFTNHSSMFARHVESNGFNHIYWTHIDYKSPSDDLNAWQHHDEPIVCHVGHNHYYDGSGGATETNEIIHTVSRFSPKIPRLGCKIKLNIQFDPFVHPNVSLEQTFHEASRTALVECPIKANSHFPIKYVISWSFSRNNNNQDWSLKHQQEFVHAADFYFIERLSYREHHDTLIKCQLFEVDKYHHHPPSHKNPIYRFNPDEKKYKLVLESVVRVLVVPMTSRAAEQDCESSWSCRWVICLGLGVLACVCYHFGTRLVKNRYKRNGSNRARFENVVRFENVGKNKTDCASPVEFSLNAVSSVELLRKNKKVKFSKNKVDEETTTVGEENRSENEEEIRSQKTDDCNDAGGSGVGGDSGVVDCETGK